MEFSINVLWRKMSVDTCTSAGRFFCRSAMAASSLSVSSMVPVLGCLVTVTNTAGFVSTDAMPSLGDLSAISTSATSDNTTGIPFMRFTTARPISSTLVVDTAPRTMYSLPYS